jgi:CubicO group peptidase (beta-lactamase class C family)
MRLFHLSRPSRPCRSLVFVASLVSAGHNAAPPVVRHALPHAAAAPAPRLDRMDLQRFVDGYVRRSVAAAHVPGAVVTVVLDGHVILARGYGSADLARHTPVSPERTLFRVASLSKLVVATAVMQLAEQGRVQLDADVNRYLRGLRVPATYPRPVTLAQLLTHTAGFEDRTIGEAALSAADLRPLRAYLADRMPARVLPPGTVFSYSNYGFALAGEVVAQVSGLPFDRYAAARIFRPLGMEASTFAQPLPAALGPRLAQGYDVPGTAARPAPFVYFNDAPADALSTTGRDMAHFMLAHLQGGCDAAGCILRPGTLQQLHALHFQATPDADFNGMAYGFTRYTRNGQLILSKDGGDRGFGSYLFLLPAHRLGVFLAANAVDTTGWMQDLERRLVNRYYPLPPAAAPVTPSGLRGSLGAFAGTYWHNRYARTTIEKLNQVTAQVQIVDTGHGTLRVTYPNGAVLHLIRVGPLRFASVYQGVTYHWAFLRDTEGHVAQFLSANDVFERVPWDETTTVQEAAIAVLVVVFLSGCLAWLVLPLVRPRWHQRGRTTPAAGGRTWDRLATAARPVAGLMCLLNLAFLVGLVLVFQGATATEPLSYTWLMYGVPAFVYALLGLPLLSTALTLLLWVCGGAAWRTRHWSLLGRVQYALVALGGVAFLLILRDWNLLGIHV